MVVKTSTIKKRHDISFSCKVCYNKFSMFAVHRPNLYIFHIDIHGKWFFPNRLKQQKLFQYSTSNAFKFINNNQYRKFIWKRYLVTLKIKFSFVVLKRTYIEISKGMLLKLKCFEIVLLKNSRKLSFPFFPPRNLLYTLFYRVVSYEMSVFTGKVI